MARIVTPLTVTKINAAKPKEKLYKLTDGGGLALWILPSGKKTWRFEYRRSDKKLDTITFGSYPELSLADARQMREAHRSLLEKGIDPKQANQQEVFISLNEVFDQWYEVWQDTVTPGYALQVYRALQANVMVCIGKRNIKELRPKDVVDALLPMQARGSLEYLRRTKQGLGQIFDFAVARGLCEFNPVASVSNKAFKRPESKHFSALKPVQLPELIALIEDSQIELITKNCIYWQLLTLCRPSEATNSSWAEMDMDKQIWLIPAERMKAGRDHIVPLSTQALNILNTMQKITGSCHHIFVGRDFKTPINRETPRIALRRFRDKGIDTTSHGLRALGRTHLAESGLWRTEVMEAALAHIEPNKVRAAYNRAEYVEERWQMLQWWGDEVGRYLLK